jgi:hypothetical protein
MLLKRDIGKPLVDLMNVHRLRYGGTCDFLKASTSQQYQRRIFLHPTALSKLEAND